MQITLYYGKQIDIKADDIYRMSGYDGELNSVDPRVQSLVVMNNDTEYYCTETYTQLCDRRREEKKTCP